MTSALVPTTKGRLLVATPPLGDPNFDRSVVYVLDHHPGGAVGVVLNDPEPEPELGDGAHPQEDAAWAAEHAEGTDALPGRDALEGLDAWIELLAPPRTLFNGGPVERDALIALAVATGRVDTAWGELTHDLGTVDLAREPFDVAERVTRLRIFRGYAGWGPGQLDAELEFGAWMVFDAEADDVFSPVPDRLWRAVIQRQGGRVAWIANAPSDLSLN